MSTPSDTLGWFADTMMKGPDATMSTKASRRWSYGGSVAAFAVVVALIIVVALILDNRNPYNIADAEPPAPATPVLEPAVSGGDAPDVDDELREVASDPDLGTLSGHVTDIATGEEVWSTRADRMLVPASATKLATAAAALTTLPADQRVSTRVLPGETEGQIVVKGEGDITLERTAGSGTFTNPAALDELAAQVTDALDDAGITEVTEIIVDNSVREGDLFNSDWSRDDIGAGNVAPLSSVMLDAGRLDPSDAYSPRSSAPAQDVATGLVEALGFPDATVTVSDKKVSTASDADDLGEVQSAPLTTRVRDMLLNSDNLLAEAIGREIAEAAGEPTTFDGATTATLEALDETGLDVSEVVLGDNSGMSRKNRLSARILDGIIASAASDTELRGILDGLPVANGSGTLVDRYDSASGATNGAGWVRAKTGTLDGVNSLAGTVTTETGRTLSFAFLSHGSDMDAGRAALDRLAAALRTVE